MHTPGLLLAALLAICFSPAAQADHIQQRGGSVFSSRIGPWYIIRQTYEDRSRVCWALNPNYGRSDPTFAYFVAVGGDHPTSMMRFDAKRPARADETVTLIVGNEQVTLIHGKEDAGNAFRPITRGDARKITRLLEQRQNQSPKNFFVVDSHGGKFRYDARSTTKMISYLEKNCGYQRQ